MAGAGLVTVLREQAEQFDQRLRCPLLRQELGSGISLRAIDLAVDLMGVPGPGERAPGW
jgi:hypothetical protein